MALTIVLALIGMTLGAFGMGVGGWLAGGGIGLLLGQFIQLSSEVKLLRRDVSDLKMEQVLRSTAEKSSFAGSTQPPAAPVASEKPQETRVPLAERIKTHDTITRPDPIAPSVTHREAGDEPETMPEVPAAAISMPPPLSIPKPVAPQPKVYPPSPADKLFAAIGRFFTEGNPIVRVGMVVMFFGLSFLAKYAASEGFIPLELRLAAVAAIALALVILGWKTRAKAGGYGLVLQGGGIAALYLTVFAALKLYSLLPPGASLVLMLVLVMLGATLAILQNAQVLALIATAGGFLSPILTSDGSGNHIALFSFYLVLNIGILTIAWFRTWRMLNWVGFVFTFIITSAWGVLSYEPHLYASTQPFLLAFFALYLLVSILFSLKQPPKLTGLVDGSLVFGLPIVAFGLQTALLKHTEYGLAISAIALSAMYVLLARLLWVKYQLTHRVLIESFIALGVTFATLAIPLALSAEWTSATWALEAAGLIWVGLRQQRLLPRVAGYLLHIAAAISLLLHDGLETGVTPIISGDFIGVFILSITALCIAYIFHHFAENIKNNEKFMGASALVVGWIWWLIAGFMELDAHIAFDPLFAATIFFFTASVFLMVALSRKLAWPQLASTGFWLLPLTLLWSAGNCAVAVLDEGYLHPTKGVGWLALGLFFAVHYCFLWLQRERPAQVLIKAYHVVSFWFVCGLICWEAYWWKIQFDWSGTSALLLWFVCLAVPLIALIQLAKKTFWPFAQYASEYKNAIPIPLVFLLILWFIEAAGYAGTTTYRFIPVLNPLDLAQLAAIILFGYAIKRNLINLAYAPKDVRYGILGGAVFVWLNIVVLRSAHHLGNIAYSMPVLWNSPEVQMALSILWTLCALAIMNLTRRYQDRKLWLLGAALLAMVVLKLFTQDLSGSGTLARIMSFLVVGALMLLIGYLAPMPPKVPSKMSPKTPDENAVKEEPVL